MEDSAELRLPVVGDKQIRIEEDYNMIVDNKTKIRRILTMILLVICIGCIAVIAWRWGEAQRAKELQQDMVTSSVKETKDPMENPIDFEALQKENPDIYAWITIPDTEISYPVVQNRNTTDLYDEYYLNHVVDGVSGFAGAIFTQRINATDFSDGNTVIYGHNLKNGTMFTHLHDYESQEFMDSHRTIYIYTPDTIFTYEVFAAVPFSDEHLMIAYDYSSKEGIQTFVDAVMDRGGVYAQDAAISGEDQLLTLSTCMNQAPNQRYLVVAKLVEQQ